MLCKEKEKLNGRINRFLYVRIIEGTEGFWVCLCSLDIMVFSEQRLSS